MKPTQFYIWCILIAASLVVLFVFTRILTAKPTKLEYMSHSSHFHIGKPAGARFSNVFQRSMNPKVLNIMSSVLNNGWSYCPVNCLKMHASLIAKTSHLKGINIECGVADGGTAMIDAAVKPKSRELHLYDTFAGIPKPMESEWGDIKELYREVKLGIFRFFGRFLINNKHEDVALRDVYENNMQAVLKTRFFGLGIDVKSNNVYFHPGLFQDTLNKTMRSDVAFAHLDGYWYESTMTALTYIMPRLLKGGYVVVDDYFSHSGCRRAVDEYFGYSLPAAYMYKKYVHKFGKKWRIDKKEYKLVLHVL